LGAYGRLSLSATSAAFVEALLQAWEEVRAGLLVPLLRAAVLLCTAMSVIVLAEKLFLGAVSSVMKLRRRRPWRVYRCDPIARPDEEAAAYPMVLVQIPMYNEKEVCTVLLLRWRLCVLPTLLLTG
jgi:beta-mannan synthase